MSNFEKAVNQVFKHEGGFAQNWAEGGGAVNYGITKQTYESFVGRSVSIDEIRNMRKSDAKQIYKEWYWDRVRGDQIISYSIAFMIFDQAVNRGVNKAISMAQEALGLPKTGSFDNNTLQAINSISEQDFIDRYADLAEREYRSLVERSPRHGEFLDGWLKRVSWLRDHAESNMMSGGSSLFPSLNLGKVAMISASVGISALILYYGVPWALEPRKTLG